MAENIDGQDLLSSGGHVWTWQHGKPQQKRFAAAGIPGEFVQTFTTGSMKAVITGRGNSPAMLKLEVEALNAVEAEIELMITTGKVVSWEDDQGHTGAELIINSYQRLGERKFTTIGETTYAIQDYKMIVTNLVGSFD